MLLTPTRFLLQRGGALLATLSRGSSRSAKKGTVQLPTKPPGRTLPQAPPQPIPATSRNQNSYQPRRRRPANSANQQSTANPPAVQLDRTGFVSAKPSQKVWEINPSLNDEHEWFGDVDFSSAYNNLCMNVLPELFDVE